MQVRPLCAESPQVKPAVLRNAYSVLEGKGLVSVPFLAPHPPFPPFLCVAFLQGKGSGFGGKGRNAGAKGGGKSDFKRKGNGKGKKRFFGNLTLSDKDLAAKQEAKRLRPVLCV